MRILIVEDDPQIASMLVKLLEKNNFIVDHQGTLKTAFEAILGCEYKAVLIDRMLPDGDGVDLIKLVRRKFALKDCPPFIVLSALGETSDKVESLDLGAVDYLVKPCEPDELLARIRVCMKYKVGGMVEEVKQANVIYNTVTHSLNIHNKKILLRRRELAIFDTLIRKFGNFVTYEELENKVYSYDDSIESNTMTAQVSRLRKILADTNSGLSIKMMRNIGYMLDVNG